MENERRLDGMHAGRSIDEVTQARRFQRKLNEVRRDRRYTAAPMIEYDESGYPLEEQKTGLTGRLRRLITG